MTNPRSQQESSNYFRRLIRDLNQKHRTLGHISLPDGSVLPLDIRLLEEGFFGGLFNSSIHLRVAPTKDAQCCRSCYRTIARLDYEPTEQNVIELHDDVRAVLRSCGKCNVSSQPELRSEAETYQPRVRISPDSEENRIRIVPQGNSTNQQASVEQQSSTPAPIKLKKPNIKVLPEGSATSTVISRGPHADSQDAAKHVYGAPSIRYRVKQNYEVEVTIPRYLCEQMILHCSESNRSRREVGGILVGYTSETPRAGSNTTLIQNNITDLFEVKASNSSNSHLTIDANNWARVGHELDARFGTSGKVRLGWYHTHPTQGIFFSPQDRDTHTNFTLNHQFALVVDPKFMLAGLFAWSDYEQRVMVESHHFPLKLRSETAESYNDQSNFSDSNPDFSIWRVFLFGIMFMVAVFYVLWSSDVSGIGPNQAILLALTGFLGMRLWNAHFFNPSVLIEKEAFLRLGQGLRSGGTLVANGLTQHPRLTMVLTILAVFVGVLGVGFMGAWLYTNQLSGDTSPAQVQTLNNSPAPAPVTLSNIRLTTRETSEASKTTLRITAKEPVAADVEYLNKGTTWEQTERGREQKFFASVFGLNLVNTDPSHLGLQQTLGAGGTIIVTFDGKWNDVTRNAFISKLPEWKRAGKILFRSQAGQASLSVE